MKIAILGTGTIARRFAAAMARVSGSEVSAVLSRDTERAEAFARKVGAARGCCDIEALLASDDVDAVYIGTPNNMHAPQSLAALRHGKPVLCEKPAFMCERDAREVISAAHDSNTLFMEAMWTRTMPGYQAAKRWLNEGRIGKLRSIYASFCFGSQYDPSSRLYDPALGGGALYDVGVYALAFALDMAGARPAGHAAHGTQRRGRLRCHKPALWRYHSHAALVHKRAAARLCLSVWRQGVYHNA